MMVFGIDTPSCHKHLVWNRLVRSPRALLVWIQMTLEGVAQRLGLWLYSCAVIWNLHIPLHVLLHLLLTDVRL